MGAPVFRAALLTTARGGAAREPSSQGEDKHVWAIYEGASFGLKKEDRLAQATTRMTLRT